MARKKSNNKESGTIWFNRLKDETKHGIIAVIAFVLGLFLTLSYLEKAGPAGASVYQFLNTFLGAGFILLPILSFVLAVSFLRLLKPNFIISRLAAGAVFLLCGLGIISILVGTETGGLLGGWISAPLLKLFDYYVTLTILGAVSLVSLFIVFDTHLSLESTFLGRPIFGKKEEENDGEEEYLAEEEKEEEEISESYLPSQEKTNESGKETENENEFGKFFSFRGRARAEGFTPPPLALLDGDSGKPGVGDIKANANIIKRTLANFGIMVEMDEISIGPSITRYALKPAEGVKLSRIVALQNDLSLALAAHPIRIEAPIPGKSLVGIELPNTSKIKVGMTSLIGSKEFSESHHPLLISLGRAIAGTAHFANLDRAPHILIAGATGSGKSVMIHALVISLLYRNPPERLRFIMVDPKRVELTMYNRIPHLLTPVVTDAKKAIMSLKWAAKEMERRYDILEREAVRDIGSYHKNIVEPSYAKGGEEDDLPDRMPYIIIIIDELADIMSTYPREMEAAVVRLAQMSRAVGIHLVLSTQRPSVEIITGLIKANIPSRVALQVASQIDSRTILDMSGAEKLLGSGDMLYISGDMSKPVRLQSAFISEKEVKRVVDWLRNQYKDELPLDIGLAGGEGRENGQSWSGEFDGEGREGDDELYEEARIIITQAGKASASYLQRRLKIGYARAARLLDMLEERGVIGPGEGAKPREVYQKGENEDYAS